MHHKRWSNLKKSKSKKNAISVTENLMLFGRKRMNVQNKNEDVNKKAKDSTIA